MLSALSDKDVAHNRTEKRVNGICHFSTRVVLSKICVTLAHFLTTVNGIYLCLNTENNEPNV